MLRIIWWVSFAAKAQGIWLLELIISILPIRFCLKNNDNFHELQKVIFQLLTILWVIVVSVVGFTTWEQVEFQSLIWTGVSSIVFFVITKLLSDVVTTLFYQKQ